MTTKMLTYHKSEIVELSSPDCSYNVHRWLPNDEKYTCFVKNQILEPGKTLTFPKFNILFMDLKKGVRALEFSDCQLFDVPKRLTDTFAYLEILSIRNCFLKEIRRSDLTEFKHLKQLHIISNEIKKLPMDLFDDVPNLEVISFYQNKISAIAPGVMENLKNLKFADFRQNENINSCYAIPPYTHPNGDYYSKISSLNNLIALIEMCTGKDTSKRLKGKSFTDDIRKFINDENFKDLIVIAGGCEFKVHKFILAARSPKLSELIQENTGDLHLTEFSSETFQKVIDFIYHEELPVEGDSFMEIYEAAGKLEITELKDFCAEQLLETISEENALEILLMSNKFNNYDLKMKSFDAIKKMFPDKKIKDELADDPETIKKMLFVRKKLEAEFENLGVYE